MPHSTAWHCLYSWASNAGGRPPGSQIHELVVTSPHYPAWGRIVIDGGGLIEWDYWGHIADDAGAADIAAVIIAVMAARPETTHSGMAGPPARQLPASATGRTRKYQTPDDRCTSARYRVRRKSGPSGVWTSCHAKALRVMS